MSKKCSVHLEVEMNVSETQKSEKSDNMENPRNSTGWKSTVLNVVGRWEEFENKPLDFIQKKRYKCLNANYVLGAFTYMKHFKKNLSSVLGCGDQTEKFGRQRTKQHQVGPQGNSRVKLERFFALFYSLVSRWGKLFARKQEET